MKKLLYSLVIIAGIILVTILTIGYGRGYRFDIRQKSIKPTGILSANSYPEAASVFVDGKLTAATNSSISLSPGWYNLRLAKDGYQAWEKRIRIQGEVVTKVDGLLIPNNPSLRALTVTGILSPALSPSGTRVAYIVPSEETTGSGHLKSRVGIWVYELRSGTLGRNTEPKQIYAPTEKTDWAKSSLHWSPDEKQIILVTRTKAVEIFPDNPNGASNVTSTLENIFSEWKLLGAEKQNQDLASLPPVLSQFLKNNASDIQFSPDNDKILYMSTYSATLAPVITPYVLVANTTEETRTVSAGKYYVYDTREDKNFAVWDKAGADAPPPLWHNDSKRIIMIENRSINIADYDNTNRRTVYSGPFEGNIVYPWTSGGKLVILTNLNNPQSLPNLYEVDIR